MAISYSDFFTKAGKAFFASSTCNTAVVTTVPDEVEDYAQQFGSSESIALHRVIDGLNDSVLALQSAGQSLGTRIARDSIQALLVQVVKADNPQIDAGATTAVAELIRQMEADSQSLDASTPGASVSYGSGNTGSGVMVCSTKRPDGKVNEHILAEDITGEVTSVSVDGSATWSLKGEEFIDTSSPLWPGGSGVGRSLISQVSTTTANLIGNGSFETEDSQVSHLPANWIASVATLGTTLKMTNVEVQTVIISGSPTGGYYLLHYTNADGDVQTTTPIAWNAVQATVQAAIQALTGLSAATVVTTGTSPNYTHTITLTGAKNPAQFTSTSGLTGGTPNIAHNTSTAASANVVRGARAIEFDSNASELTTLNRKVSVQAATQYAFSALFKVDSVPAAGVLTVDLVDGIGGSVIRDDEGFYNTFEIDATDLTTTFQTPAELLSAVNEVQTLTITGTPTGGNFTITYDGQTTGNIAYNADAATVEAALEALSTIGTGNISCGGGALPGSAVTITGANKLAGQDLPLATADGSGLTGGTTPDAAIALTTQGVPAAPVFRTPTNLPENVYLRIRISTAVSNTTSVFVDEAILLPMNELYAGGLWVAAFEGATPSVVGDTATIAVTNDRAGSLHEWLDRAFDLRTNRLLMPTNASGAETINDSLIS